MGYAPEAAGGPGGTDYNPHLETAIPPVAAPAQDHRHDAQTQERITMKNRSVPKPNKRLRFVISNKDYIAQQQKLRERYERNKAEEQAKILSGYYRAATRRTFIS